MIPDSILDQPIRPSPDKLQAFIASLPGMACQIQLHHGGTVTFPYASDGCSALLGIAPDVLQNDSSSFLNLIHPDDIPSFLETLKQSATTMCFWKWEGRLNLADNTVKWISLGATPRQAENALPRWEGIVFDITQNKLGELELRHSQQQLKELASHIQEAKEEERLRIAREIHDEIGSLLTAIRIDFSWLSQRLPKGNQLLVDKAAAITELLNKTITSAGNLAQSLRPGFLDDFGIITAIEIEAQEFSARSGVSCTIIKSEEAIDLPEAATISLFRIFQETLNNIMKHAQAKNVQIEIVKGEDHLELVILDDGVGFTEEARNKPRSFGLRGIHERVAHLGGTVKIASKPNGGTQIAICIPLDAESTLQESAQQQLFANKTT